MGRSPLALRLMKGALALLAASLTISHAAAAGAAAPWRVVRSLNIGAVRSSFAAVSGVSASDVWAVGSSYDAARAEDVALAEHWNGSAWSVVPVPRVGAGSTAFSGVATVASNDVWAVGYFEESRFGPQASLIQHWDGAAWSQFTAPPRLQWDELVDVSAVSSTDVWAVGNGYLDMFVIHWDGATWTDVDSPNVGAFTGVGAVSSNDVWAVGQAVGQRGTYNTLAEHWNGSSWTITPTPNRDTTFNELFAVDGSSSSDAWAVGASWDFEPFQTLILHWDGTTWIMIGSPNVGDGQLFGVSALSPTDAWAVGEANGVTLTEHWNGSNWVVVPSPHPGDSSALSGTALAGGQLWAVGSATVGTAVKTLTMVNTQP